MSLNIATVLREAAAAQPDRTCLVLGPRTVSYAEVDTESARLAAGVLSLGLERGDAVAVQLANSADFVFAYFGLMRAGLVMVPMNPLLREREVAHLLADSGARALLTGSPHLDEVAAAAGDLPVFVAGSGPVPEGCRSLTELYADEPFRDVVPTSSEDTAVLLYTSGTTGRPKGAELTHLQLVFNSINSGALFGFGPDDVSLAVVPFFHVYGLSLIGVAVRYVSTITVMERFDAAAAVEAMERDGVSIMFGVPTMYHALLQQDTSGRDLSRFRLAVSGGAAIPGEILREVEERYGVLLLEGYGLSESCATATFNRSFEDRRFLSIGKPIWGVEVVVVDGDGRRLPRGAEHVGELVVRGHNVMKGYRNNPEATAEALRDGWLHTGDLGYEDEDGYLFVVDRLKDLVIRGGYNVYPREIEEVLYAHPAISEAAVIGRPDDRLGEEVVAVVVLRPGAEATEADVIAFCKARLAAYKYPREVRLVPDLPKGSTGKILKKELR
ncbi:long-chain-fatty-acid--CoA ligase [Nocardioides marmoribigeumensis]|uniref:Long-chain acyl-CoA synthetase n=1 Tax=Nocardioides marmoribigeumensis TaxID=433649 RepID=A0ABU2BXZ7_9ACTN|nr:long-chain fatty acid--CoA ligase [Nocardioides marmoribigeumensis]MDR7363266.1 long-chain acyl-CoA synthetase [Nocardioides marmoribigeumensis]